jgi:putative salt-induced outer membrane protein YdiY
MRNQILAVIVAGLAMAPLAHADEIVFKNGDHLTGKVTSAAGGKLHVTTPVAGDVVIDLSTVHSFSTDDAIELRLNDGTTLKQKVEAADEGTIRTAPGVLGPQVVKFSDIDQINPPPVKWTGSIRASANFVRGNTFSDSADVAIDASRRSTDDRITLGAGYSFGRERNADTGQKSTTEDNWFASGKYDYFLNKKLYLFGLIRVEKDRIANLDLRVSPSAGLGYQWIEKPDFNFNTELGGGWVHESYTNDGSDSHFTARAAYHVDKSFNERIKLFHDLEYLPSVERGSDYNVNADIGMRMMLTKQFFSEFRVDWQFDSTPAPGAEKHDLKYLVSLGWQF